MGKFFNLIIEEERLQNQGSGAAGLTLTWEMKIFEHLTRPLQLH